MKTLKIIAVVLTFSLLSSCDALKTAVEQGGGLGNMPLTQEEVVRGLKSALTTGTDSAVRRLNATDGFLKDAAIKILLPPEAQNILIRLNKIPGGQALVDKAITAVNRAAEDAASTAGPIFSNAVKNMSIQDAFGILRGADTAATHYLRNNTLSQLHAAFKPKIEASLSKPLVYGVSAESLYKDLIDAYNLASVGGALFPKVTENSLSDHVTARALDGVFLKISNEEKAIRQDPAHRVTSILQRVFGSQQ